MVLLLNRACRHLNRTLIHQRMLRPYVDAGARIFDGIHQNITAVGQLVESRKTGPRKAPKSEPSPVDKGR
jgi:hypothetical protein